MSKIFLSLLFLTWGYCCWSPEFWWSPSISNNNNIKKYVTCVFRRKKNLFLFLLLSFPFAFDSAQSQKEKIKKLWLTDTQSVWFVWMCGRDAEEEEEEEKQDSSLLSLSPNKEKSTNEESMSKRSTGPGVVKKEREKKAFDDFDGEEAKTLTTTRKRG